MTNLLRKKTAFSSDNFEFEAELDSDEYGIIGLLKEMS